MLYNKKQLVSLIDKYPPRLPIDIIHIIYEDIQAMYVAEKMRDLMAELLSVDYRIPVTSMVYRVVERCWEYYFTLDILRQGSIEVFNIYPETNDIITHNYMQAPSNLTLQSSGNFQVQDYDWYLFISLSNVDLGEWQISPLNLCKIFMCFSGVGVFDPVFVVYIKCAHNQVTYHQVWKLTHLEHDSVSPTLVSSSCFMW